jgi:uncharacterized protein (TIGR02301 family)
MVARLLRAVFVLALTLLLLEPAGAQFWSFPESKPQPPQQQRPRAPLSRPTHPPGQTSAPADSGQPVAPSQDQPAPYDHDLQRLSEILGALHFLRGLCGAGADGQKWRDEAQAVIDAEAPSGQRHAAMVAAFNRGYRGFQQSYRTCTPAADLVIRRYLNEGAKIARDLTARYTN